MQEKEKDKDKNINRIKAVLAEQRLAGQLNKD